MAAGYQRMKKVKGSRTRNTGWNLVLVSEGYKSNQLAGFENHAAEFTEALWNAEPFKSMKARIVVWRMNFASVDEGASVNAGCGQTAVTKDTYFKSSFCNDGILRKMAIDDDFVISEVDAHLPEWHSILVFVKSNVAGGKGGDHTGVTVFSLAGGTTFAWQRALHELGHTVGGLADEYEYYGGCGTGESGHDTYAGCEFAEPNVTKGADAVAYPTQTRNVRWGSLLETSAIPTTLNANPSQCDTQSEPAPFGKVGLFDGARFFHHAACRPKFNCRMRVFTVDFCKVCQEAIRNGLSSFA